ncbi:MAG: GntR family transcriptional regulator [Bryobacterales bacterium]|nr:GntR family transcriptional regulator [Bryobacterales bacterium]
MFLTVDARDERPLYRQVADGIKDWIARGELREGMTLPSVRQLAGDLGVNLNTIASAYRELQDEGFVKIRHGAGAVVASACAREAEVSELRKPLRKALTQFVLAGIDDADIVAFVRQELESLHRKGGSQ